VVGLVLSHDPESYAGGRLLLVGPPMPDRSRVMTQTKKDTLVLQVGGLAWGLQSHKVKKNIVTKVEQSWMNLTL
jgi:hypothetical protein